MEIILKKDVPKLGDKNDILKVKTGFAVNYLIPKKIAIQATANAKVILAEDLRQQTHKEAKLRDAAQQTANKLQGVKLKIGAKTSTTGKIFGSVTNIQLAEELEKQGFEVDRKRISFEAIKEVGTYKATVSLYKDIKAEIEFEVISE